VLDVGCVCILYIELIYIVVVEHFFRFIIYRLPPLDEDLEW